MQCFAPGAYQPSDDNALQEEATLTPSAAEVLRELCACTTVCILAHVAGDVGEAVVKGTLEAAGLVGPGQGQVPEHRVLCCSTPPGKVSMVQQLEPGLHIDAEASTVGCCRWPSWTRAGAR